MEVRLAILLGFTVVFIAEGSNEFTPAALTLGYERTSQTDIGSGIVAVDLSDDGSVLAVSTNKEGYVIDMKSMTSTPMDITDCMQNEARVCTPTLYVTDDGEIIVMFSSKGIYYRTRKWREDGTAVLSSLPSSTTIDQNPSSWVVRGKTIASCTDNGKTLRLWQFKSGPYTPGEQVQIEHNATIPLTDMLCTTLSLNANGSIAILKSDDNIVWLVSDDGKPLTQTSGFNSKTKALSGVQTLMTTTSGSFTAALNGSKGSYSVTVSSLDMEKSVVVSDSIIEHKVPIAEGDGDRVTFAWMQSNDVSKIGLSMDKLKLLETWELKGSVASLDLSQSGSQLVVANDSHVDIYHRCYSTMVEKHYNIPHNGYRSIKEATLSECSELCCQDKGKCNIFQWIEKIPINTKYSHVQCLLFEEGESDLVVDNDQPFHTYIIGESYPHAGDDDDDDGLSAVAVFFIVVASLVLCSLFAAAAMLCNRQLATRTKEGTTHKHTKVGKIDASLLANEVNGDHEIENRKNKIEDADI